MGMLNNMKETLVSDTSKSIGKEIANDIYDTLNMDPRAAKELIETLKSLRPSVRDGIFYECFETYLLNLNGYDSNKDIFIEDNLRKMAECLAEVSPNEDAHYVGDPDRLREYAKRIVKLIDDCGTNQKAFYIANISRALANKFISKAQFFKLAQCIRMLTEEDLLFLTSNVTDEIIEDEAEYLDDFRGLGLMYEVNGGFAYSQRAFLLLKYALRYEEKIEIPETFPDRNIISTASVEEVEEYLKL